MNIDLFKRSRPILLILALAFLVRLGWMLFTPALPTSDFAWYDRVATAVAQGHGYSLNGVPTAFRVPGYPLLLAGIYAAFGHSLFLAKLANVILGTLSVLLVFLLAQEALNARGAVVAAGITAPALGAETAPVQAAKVAVVAAGIVAFTPSLVLYAGLLASENLVVPLLLASLLFYVRAVQRDRVGCVWLAGLMLGLGTLTRPLILFLPGLWLALLLFRRVGLRTIVPHGLILCAAIGLCIAPWAVRNQIVLDRFVPLATDGPVNLLVSFNERSVGRFVPGAQAALVAKGAALGWDERRLEREMLDEALRFIKQRPLRALALMPLKLFHLFRDDVSGVIWNFTDSSRQAPRLLRWVLLGITQGYYMVMMGLALAAVVWRRRLANYAWCGLLLTPILYWAALHLVFFGDDRYHLPILPLIAIFSAFSALQVIDHWVKKQTA